MPYFQSVPKVIHAEQYIAGKEVQGVQYKGEAYVETIQGQQVLVKEGEWIIRESDGIHYYPCDPIEFNKLYTPLLPGNEYND